VRDKDKAVRLAAWKIIKSSDITKIVPLLGNHQLCFLIQQGLADSHPEVIEVAELTRMFVIVLY
jgi:hypothetical protein